MHIHLKDLKFFAHHGIYEHEKQNGNQFVVNVHIGFDGAGENAAKHIDQTINYEKVFDMVNERMKIATPLLETICGDLVRGILDRFPQAMHAEVAIEKMNPPIPEMQGSVVVVESLHRMLPDSNDN